MLSLCHYHSTTNAVHVHISCCPHFISPLPLLSFHFLLTPASTVTASCSREGRRRGIFWKLDGHLQSKYVCLEPPNLHHCPFSFPPSFLPFLLPCSPTQPLCFTPSFLFLPVGTGVDRELQRLLANERVNFKLLAEKVRKSLIL